VVFQGSHGLASARPCHPTRNFSRDGALGLFVTALHPIRGGASGGQRHHGFRFAPPVATVRCPCRGKQNWRSSIKTCDVGRGHRVAAERAEQRLLAGESQTQPRVKPSLYDKRGAGEPGLRVGLRPSGISSPSLRYGCDSDIMPLESLVGRYGSTNPSLEEAKRCFDHERGSSLQR